MLVNTTSRHVAPPKRLVKDLCCRGFNSLSNVLLKVRVSCTEWQPALLAVKPLSCVSGCPIAACACVCGGPLQQPGQQEGRQQHLQQGRARPLGGLCSAGDASTAGSLCEARLNHVAVLVQRNVCGGVGLEDELAQNLGPAGSQTPASTSCRLAITTQAGWPGADSGRLGQGSRSRPTAAKLTCSVGC